MSEITLWEIAMLCSRGRINLGAEYSVFMDALMRARHYQMIGIDSHIAFLSTQLSPHLSTDPADQIIVATAMFKKLSLVTADKLIRKFGEVEVIW